MPLILGTNSIKDTGFDVANSLRFNSGSSDSLSRTLSGGDRQKMTFSCWVKRSSNGGTQNVMVFWTDANNNFLIRFVDSGALDIESLVSGAYAGNNRTTRLFRDVSAWYHIVIRVDTTNGTAGDRIRIYINNTEEISFSDSSNPNSSANLNINTNGQTLYVGRTNGGSYFNGYMAEVVLIDGQALDPTSFGEFDEDSGIWKPKNVSGLTFGTNGFYLDFEDSSALGNDAAGSNNFTVNNLTAIDQSTDTCTNNFATMNPLDNYYASSTFAEGNLKITTNASNQTFNTGTIGLSTGKWYWEAKLVQAGGEEAIGITDIVSTGTGIYGGKTANNYSFKGNNGDIRNNDSNSSYGSAYAQDSIISVFMDLDNNKLYFAIDGTLQNSGTGHSITAPASTTNGVYFPMVGDVDTDSVIWECNFGSPSFAISSGNTDGEYGNFEYSTTITGDGASKTFKALNTKNLAEFG